MSFHYDSAQWNGESSFSVAAGQSDTAAAEPREMYSPGLDGKRQRVSRACDRCRRKKVKCDGKRPICTHCEAINGSCTYLDATKKRGPPKGYIDVIENRLHKVEELLCALIMTDSAAARFVLDDLQSSNPNESAVVSDAHGRLFGRFTMAELGARASQPRMQAPLVLSESERQSAPTPVPASVSTVADQSDTGTAWADSGAALDMSADASTRMHEQADSSHGGSNSDGDDDGNGNGDSNNNNNNNNDNEGSLDNIAKLEKRVGHLTLDQSGSLRYLGNSSGWYLINRSLMSSEASPRLTKGVDGAIRWPPISTYSARENEPANASSITTSNSGSSISSPRTETSPDFVTPVSASAAAWAPVGGSYEALATATARATATATATASASVSAPAHANLRSVSNDSPQGQQFGVVPVPRNMPPCGKPPMPDDEEKGVLLSLYFRYVHPGFPILYKSHFLKQAFDKKNSQSPALMSAVYAAASTYKIREVVGKADLARARIQMVVHFQRAKLYLDEQYTYNNTPTILTLLLMSVYEQGTMSTRSWLYSGMAVRKAYDLGIHRDVGVAKNNVMAVVSSVEAEIRQRAWWGCYIMDIMVSATLGRPTTIRDFTFDAPYPTNFGEDDDELFLESPVVPGTYSSQGVFVPSSPSQPKKWPRQQQQKQQSEQQQQSESSSVPVAERMLDYVSLTIGDSDSEESDSGTTQGPKQPRPPKKRRAMGEYYLDLLHVLGHVVTEMYTCKPNRGYAAQFCLNSVSSRAERLIVLDHELRRWKQLLPQKLQYPVDDILAARPPRCVYIALIHLVYHTAMILLHRPFISKLGENNNPGSPMATDDSQASGSDVGSPGGSAGTGNSASRSTAPPPPLPSHSICTLSAQMITLIGQGITQDSQIFIMPFLTFMMFTAGTMHLNNVIVAADSWLARRFLKRTLEVMSRSGAHWQVSYKCYTMLNTLVRANRIGLDQVIDDPEAGIRVIKERAHEISRVAHSVYENRSQYRDILASSKMGTAQTSTPRSRQVTPKSGYGFEANRSSASRLSIAAGKASSPLVADADAQSYFPASPIVAAKRNVPVPMPPPAPAPRRSTLTGPLYPKAAAPFAAGPGAAGHSTSGSMTMDVDSGLSALPQARGLKRWPSSSNIGRTSATDYSPHAQMPPHASASTSSKSGSGYARPAAGSSDDNHSESMRPPAGTGVFALRNSLSKNGKPATPEMPYMTVDLAASKNSAADLMRTTLVAEKHSARVDPSRSASSSLGQFVPSLEFFANAEFPLGIGGPNGQATSMHPPAMGTRRGNSNNDVGGGRVAATGGGLLGRANSSTGSVTGGFSGGTPFVFMPFLSPFGQPPGMSPTSESTSSYAGMPGLSMGANVGISTALPTLSPSANNINANNYFSPSTAALTASVSSDGFGYNSASSMAAPTGFGFGGMLIDDDVIRNLPFSGPASFDLNLGGMSDTASMMAALHQQQQQQQQQHQHQHHHHHHHHHNLMDINRDGPAGVTTGPISGAFTTGAGDAEGSEDTARNAANAETPWKDYVSQVIRMFNEGYQATDKGSNFETD